MKQHFFCLLYFDTSNPTRYTESGKVEYFREDDVFRGMKTSTVCPLQHFGCLDKALLYFIIFGKF